MMDFKMKSYIDGDCVCLVNDDFQDLQNSDAIFCTEPRELASALVLAQRIVDPESYRAKFWLRPEDFEKDQIAFKEGGKTLKVTIEWANEPESEE